MNTVVAYQKIQAILGQFNSKDKNKLIALLTPDDVIDLDNAYLSADQVELLSMCGESNISNGVRCCPHCGSVAVIKNGKVKGRQRYQCKDCKKTYGDTFGTIMFHSRVSADKWKQFISMTLHNNSIRRIAKDLSLNKSTVWFNRHRLCTAFKGAVDIEGLTTIVEADEWYIPLSFLGLQDKEFFVETLGRMPRHNRNFAEKSKYVGDLGIKVEDVEDSDEEQTSPSQQAQELNGLFAEEKHKRGISNDLVAVLTCLDRAKANVLKPSCLGRITDQHLINDIGWYFQTDSVLVSDSHNAYNGFTSKMGIHWEKIPSGKHSRGAFNLANVNSFHSRLTDHFKPYKQVATKYLDNYLALFQWKDSRRRQATQTMTAEMLTYICGQVPLLQMKNLGRKWLTIDTKGLVTVPV